MQNFLLLRNHTLGKEIYSDVTPITASVIVLPTGNAHTVAITLEVQPRRPGVVPGEQERTLLTATLGLHCT